MGNVKPDSLDGSTNNPGNSGGTRHIVLIIPLLIELLNPQCHDGSGTVAPPTHALTLHAAVDHQRHGSLNQPTPNWKACLTPGGIVADPVALRV